jgi:hypothetical protein
MTITLGWWAVPALLTIAGLGLWWHGSRESGMMGGLVQFLLGVGLFIGALASCAVGWIK